MIAEGQGAESAVLVKVRSGEISATDGPFAETKEQLLGFVMLEAESLDDALEIAGGFPIAYISSHVALLWQGRLEPGETLLVCEMTPALFAVSAWS